MLPQYPPTTIGIRSTNWRVFFRRANPPKYYGVLLFIITVVTSPSLNRDTTTAYGDWSTLKNFSEVLQSRSWSNLEPANWQTVTTKMPYFICLYEVLAPAAQPWHRARNYRPPRFVLCTE